MPDTQPTRLRTAFIWTALAVATGLPVIAATFSPLLAWRDPIYIAAGLAGVVAMALLLVQPLLVGGYLPNLSGPRARRLHRAIGILVLLAVIIHIGGLWITSPPDVVDALLLASPTPFSIWGVLAMWALFAAALVAALRKRIRPRTWRRIHTALAGAVVAGTVIHALLIDGTMEPASKYILSAVLIAATAKVMADMRRRTRKTPAR